MWLAKVVVLAIPMHAGGEETMVVSITESTVTSGEVTATNPVSAGGEATKAVGVIPVHAGGEVTMGV